MGAEAKVESNLLLSIDSLQGGLNYFCLTHIQRYRYTCGSRRYRCIHLFIATTLQHIIKRPLKVNVSHCSLIAVELSLCELIILLVDLFFELIFVECRLRSFMLSVPSLLTKLPPKIETFEAPAKKAMIRRSEEIKQQVDCGLNTKTCCALEQPLGLS